VGDPCALPDGTRETPMLGVGNSPVDLSLAFEIVLLGFTYLTPRFLFKLEGVTEATRGSAVLSLILPEGSSGDCDGAAEGLG
jgi:hypothetical protein